MRCRLLQRDLSHKLAVIDTEDQLTLYELLDAGSVKRWGVIGGRSCSVKDLGPEALGVCVAKPQAKPSEPGGEPDG